MYVLVLTLLLAIATPPIGSTAQVQLKSYGQTYTYTGILVKPNELAPCFAQSKKQDVILSGSYSIVAWPRPCPQIPLTISPTAVGRYLQGSVTLLQASQSP